MRGFLVLLAGCATTASGTDPAIPGAEAVFFAEAWGECAQVFTGSDAQALHTAGARLAPLGTCAFDGVYVRGSQAIVVFALPSGKKSAAMLRPTGCVRKPAESALVAPPYVVDVAEGAEAACPQAISALLAAAREQTLPPPSAAQNPESPQVTPGTAPPAEASPTEAPGAAGR